MKVFLVLLFLTPSFVFSDGISFTPSLGVQGQTYPTSPVSGQPDPTGIQSSPLISFLAFDYKINITDEISLDLGLEFHTKEYVFKPLIGHAFPTPIETGADAGVVSSVLGLFPEVIFDFKIPTENSNYISLNAGINFAIRLAVQALDNSGDLTTTSQDLLGNFRIPQLKVGFGYAFLIDKNLFLIPKLSYQLPIYRLWDGDGYSILDRSIIQLGMQILVILPESSPPTAQSPSVQE